MRSMSRQAKVTKLMRAGRFTIRRQLCPATPPYLRPQVAEVGTEVLPRLPIQADLWKYQQCRPWIDDSRVDALLSSEAVPVGMTVGFETVSPSQPGQLRHHGFLDRTTDTRRS